MRGEVNISHILGTFRGDLEMGSSSFESGRGSLGTVADQNVSLATYASHVLKQICTQPWDHQRCLQTNCSNLTVLFDQSPSPAAVAYDQPVGTN